MVAAKRTTVVKPAVKAPPKPKFGEVGFKFPVMAKIVATTPEADTSEYDFTIELDIGNYEDWDSPNCNSKMEFSYSAEDFKKWYASCDPKFLKVQKQEELKQAQALVAKLTKEIAAIK